MTTQMPMDTARFTRREAPRPRRALVAEAVSTHTSSTSTAPKRKYSSSFREVVSRNKISTTNRMPTKARLA